MALIKCPECGKEVSDRAANCINCGFPLSSLRTDGEVMIMISSKLQGRCKVYDMNSRKVLWEGTTGEVAVFTIKEPTWVGVAWGFSVDRLDKVPDACRATVKAGEKWEMTMESTSLWGGMEYKLRRVDSINAGR